MNVKLRIPVVVLASLLAGAGISIAQVINLSDAGPSGAAIQWQGPQANARAGTTLARADMSGDVDRVDLIVGAPGAGPHGEGQLYILFMGPTYTSGSVAAAATVIVTGATTGDEFGAGATAGMIVRREVAPLPPRDLVVGAPSAFSGHGAVYLFPGPFPTADRRDASAATFRVIGAPGDRLGGNLTAIDLDGDGYRDIVMAAPATGRIYVIFGSPSLSGTRDLSVTPADLTITLAPGPVAVAAGDFNNDGFKDLVVGVASAGAAGTAYLIKGKARAAFPATLAITSADAQFTGIDAGDAAGTSVLAADFDGDGVTDLLVGAPNAAGPANGRAGAGEAYVLFGRSQFGASASLASADTTIYGAHAGDHLATVIGAGHIRRDLPDDLMLLAPGASAAADIDILYGGPRGSPGGAIDLAAGIDRVLRGDPARPPVESMVSVPVTGKGWDVVAATPWNAGYLYVALSPTLSLDPPTTTITVAQGATATATVHVTNLGNIAAGWVARPNTSWLAMTPASGTSSAATPGDLTLTITPGNLAPGIYHGGFTYLSNSRDLLWTEAGSVDLTVVAGSGGSQPTNLFGLPSDPDEGSPGGVNTPVGSNVTVVPVRDFLVRFTNVTQAGRTIVDVQPAGSPQPGARPTPWIYSVRTTAVYSGPVIVGNAYEASFTTREGDVRIFSGSSDITTSVDTSLHAVYGSTSSLPSTFSTIEDLRRLVMTAIVGNGIGTIHTSVTPVNAPNCGENCFAFVSGTSVTLTAAPASGTTFNGWGGACASFGMTLTCTLTMPLARTVTSVTWNLSRPVPSGGGGPGPAPDPGPPPPPPPPYESPFSPSSVRWLADGSTVVLTWATNRAGPRATHYIIEVGRGPDLGDLAEIDTGNASPFLIAQGVPNGSYWVGIRSASAAGWSAPSNPTLVVVGGARAGSGPGAPVNVTSTVDGGHVALRWQAAPGTSPTAYIIEAGAGLGGNELANFSTGSNATEFHANGVGAGVYFVRIRAVLPSGISGPSNEIIVIVR